MAALVFSIIIILLAIALPFISSKAGYGKIGGIGSVIALAVAGVIMFLACTSTIPTGHTGILTTFGRVEERNLPEGLNFHAPWQNIEVMSNKEQTFTYTNAAFSMDLQEVTYTYTAKYNITSAAAPNIYKTVGFDYFNILIRPRIDNAIKAEFGIVAAEDMTGIRTQIQTNVENTVRAYAEQYGINVTVVIDDFDFSDAYTNAIEAKQVAEQNALRDRTEQEMETERTRQQAERVKIEAQNAAEIREINAAAEADATRVKAQADYDVAQLEADAIAYKGQKEAEATAALAAAITDEVVAYEYAQNWSGNLPTYMMGGQSALPIIDIPMGEGE